MSYIVPGPERRPDAFFARRDAAPPPAAPGSASEKELKEKVAMSTWPPQLGKLIADDNRRQIALADNRPNTANAALVDVVRGLDDLLRLAASRIKAEPAKRPRRRARQDTAAVAAGSLLPDLPLREVAELLRIPADDVDEVLAAVRQPAFDGRAARREALRAIDELRRQLQEIEITRNHSRLSRLRDFIVRLVLVLGTAVGSHSASELVAGDPHVEAFLQVAVGALAGYALQSMIELIRTSRHDRAPAIRAAESHRLLLSALTDAEALTGTEAYPNEHTMLTFRLLVRSAHSWVMCFEIDWPFAQKLAYWQALDQIAPTLRAGSINDFRTLRRRLQALTPTQP